MSDPKPSSTAAAAAPPSDAESGSTSEEPKLGEVTGATEDALIEIEVRDWINGQVALEMQRLRDQGARAIPVPVKNMGIYRVCTMMCLPRGLVLILRR